MTEKVKTHVPANNTVEIDENNFSLGGIPFSRRHSENHRRLVDGELGPYSRVMYKKLYGLLDLTLNQQEKEK